MLGKKETPAKGPTVFIVDDDLAVRDALENMVQSVGLRAVTFGTAGEFLQAERPDAPSCLVLDVRLPKVNGLEFQAELEKLSIRLPIIFISGYADVPMSVQAMRRGALDFFCKPVRELDLLTAIQAALERDGEWRKQRSVITNLQTLYDSLTPREQEVMGLVVKGLMNKQMAWQLGISEITVKVHRANVMRKMGAQSLAELVRMADTLASHRS
jgi:FixJ family two-component response regulator